MDPTTARAKIKMVRNFLRNLKADFIHEFVETKTDLSAGFTCDLRYTPLYFLLWDLVKLMSAMNIEHKP